MSKYDEQDFKDKTLRATEVLTKALSDACDAASEEAAMLSLVVGGEEARKHINADHKELAEWLVHNKTKEK